MRTNAIRMRSKALESAKDALKTQITQTCPDTLLGRVGMHTRCARDAQAMHEECTSNARAHSAPGSSNGAHPGFLLSLSPPFLKILSMWKM